MEVHVILVVVVVVSSGKVHGGQCWSLVAKYRCGPGLAVWIAPLGNLDGRVLAGNRFFFGSLSIYLDIYLSLSFLQCLLLHGQWTSNSDVARSQKASDV